MKTTSVLNKRPRKDDSIRVRCTQGWKDRIETIALLVESDASHLIRDAVNAHIEKLMVANPVIRLHVTR